MNNKYRSKANALLGMVTPILLAVSVRADGFADSSVATGTLALVRDVTAWVTVLCPLVCGRVAIYFAIRKGMADEQDGKMWQRRITNAIIWGVGGGLIAGIIALVSSYYTGA